MKTPNITTKKARIMPLSMKLPTNMHVTMVITRLAAFCIGPSGEVSLAFSGVRLLMKLKV